MDIALTMGGSFLSSFLQVLFDRMARPEFLNLFRQQRYDDRILEKLNWKLLTLQAVLEDAENKQTKNLAIKRWLDELQEVVYQADDLLDQINTEALTIAVGSRYPSSTNHVSASADPSSFSIEFLKEIMPNLEEIIEKLEDFEHKIGILGLVKEVELKKQPFRLPSTSLVGENDVYGRDADREKIIEALLSDFDNRENVSVVSIVGLGGVGKTTLAQLVYNDERVKKQFDVSAWVCISEEYDAIRVTKLLLHELNISSNSDSNESFNSLQVKLKEGLFKKKFLIVLDDVWNRDYSDWLALSAPFGGGKEGSKIIVTTRDEIVASTIGNQYIYHLHGMSDEYCWFIFQKHAFSNRDCTGNLQFELIGKEILKKCKGLPLAVKVVAGLLRSKATIEEWSEILRSDEWDQTNNDKILPSLRLSYTQLCSHLKRCFAYCAVFHKGYQFNKNEVILLWMANDLLEGSRNNKRLEDVGNEYFCELTFRSLFHKSTNGKFSMHDLVNDLAKFVSGKYFLRLEDHQKFYGSSTAMRHFSYLCSSSYALQKFEPLNESKFLRTFLSLDFLGIRYFGWNMLGHKLLVDVLPAFKSLRTLSLVGYEIKELPNAFSNLKQLRFLNLSFTPIIKLPSWICNFYNLQTLLLAGCMYLQEFPEGMEKLIKLCCLDVTGIPWTKMPMEIGRLENLQFLSTESFIVSKDGGSRIEELGKLCILTREFTISGLENVANGESAAIAKMKGKNYLRELTLEWNGDVDNSQLVKDVLENLQPCFEIEHIVINRYPGTCFSDWLGDPSFCRLISLCLSCCENCFCLPAIGQLPSLKYLSIYGLSKILKMGEEFYGIAKPFLCLKEFRIENMRELREWNVQESGVFSCLEELHIVNCPELIGEIPNQLPSVRRLRICGCPGLVNADGGLIIFEPRPDLLLQLYSLRELEISNMPNLKELSSSFLDLNKLLPGLDTLTIQHCQQIIHFPINRLPTALKKLGIHGCGHLELETHEMTCHISIKWLEIFGGSDSVPKNLSLGSLPDLQLLHHGLKSMEGLSVAQGNQNLTSLQILEIGNCDNFVSFPVGGLPAPCLTSIELWHCRKLSSLPERMHTLLPSLREMHLDNCPEIECFPEGACPLA